MRNRTKRNNSGSCFVVMMVGIVVIGLVVVFGTKSYIDSLTRYDVPVKYGDYLIYDFRRGYGDEGYTDLIKFRFKDPEDGKIEFKVTDIHHGKSETLEINSSFKFEDNAQKLYIMGVAPVWYPRNRLAKGGNVRGKRILEQIEWNGWDVWVAGEQKFGAMYYERSTGFLVGFEFVTPESTSAILKETNIEALKH